MTLRESIVRRKRIGAIVTYLGLAWFVAWMALSEAQPPWLFVAQRAATRSGVYATVLGPAPEAES